MVIPPYPPIPEPVPIVDGYFVLPEIALEDYLEAVTSALAAAGLRYTDLSYSHVNASPYPTLEFEGVGSLHYDDRPKIDAERFRRVFRREAAPAGRFKVLVSEDLHAMRGDMTLQGFPRLYDLQTAVYLLNLWVCKMDLNLFRIRTGGT